MVVGQLAKEHKGMGNYTVASKLIGVLERGIDSGRDEARDVN